VEKFLLFLLLIAVVVIIVAIELYLNLDKHRFRMLMQWKRMNPMIVKWVDNAASIKSRIEDKGVEMADVEADIAAYRASVKKPLIQIHSVNNICRSVQSKISPEDYGDPVFESLLESRGDIESELADGVESFNICVKTLNKKFDSMFFRPVAKVFRVKMGEELIIGRSE